MPQVIFALAAIPDLQRLRDFLRSKSADAAHRAGVAIQRDVRILGAHPSLGRLVDDLPEQFREWLIDFGDSGYVVRYRIGDDAVPILIIRLQKEARTS